MTSSGSDSDSLFEVPVVESSPGSDSDSLFEVPVVESSYHPSFSLTGGAGRMIGIAVDLSEESTYAVQWTVKNYLRPGDAVFLLNVQPTSVLYDESERKLEEDSANKKVNEVAQPLVDMGIIVCTHTVQDHNMKKRLCSEVKNQNLSILIMGNRGLGATKEKLGSVTDYCVRHCTCPVVVVRFQEIVPEDDAVVPEVAVDEDQQG